MEAALSEVRIERLPPAIHREIESHKYLLSERAQRDVGFDAAREDWFAHHYAAYCRFRYEQLLRLQNIEIGKYKWIRSEEAKRDIGREAALEWVVRYARSFREQFESEYGPVEI
jgi:hypothetical protein